MTAIVTSIEVDRPAEDVFAYATDPTRFPEWQHGVVSGHLETSGPPTVGTKCHATRRIGGHRTRRRSGKQRNHHHSTLGRSHCRRASAVHVR